MTDVVDTAPSVFADIGKELAKFEKMSIFIGFQGAAAAIFDGDASVVDIATFNEFGTKDVPPRPFLRSTIDTNREKYLKVLQDVTGQILDRKMTALEAAERIGILAQADVQKKIRNLRTPANKQSTIDKKGSDNPLVDIGRLLQSVTYTVRVGGAVVSGNAN